MTALACEITNAELVQVRVLTSLLPVDRKVFVADTRGPDFSDTAVLAVLYERQQMFPKRTALVNVHTISLDNDDVKWTSVAVKGANFSHYWSGIIRDPCESAFRVDMLLISAMSDEATLNVLKAWVPHMRTNAPVWIHNSDAYTQYPHIRLIGCIEKGAACLVTD